MNEFLKKRYLIVGGGISGKGSARALKRVGAIVSFYNGTIPDDVDGIVLSPGIDSSPFVAYAIAHGKEIFSEIELGYRLERAPIVAITGTNGKTTTTMMTAEMLAVGGFKTEVCGNIGKSFAGCALESHDYAVVETSSFQLMNVVEFRPKIGIITNITPDHLDRHGNMYNYAAAKFNIARCQTSKDWLIVDSSLKTEEYSRFFDNIKSHIITIGEESRVQNDSLYVLDEYLCKTTDVKACGEHNIKNALFAATAAALIGVKRQDIVLTLGCFSLSMHRLHFSGEYGGKKFFNDSKGTNVGAALAAARCMDASTCLIAGGSDKGISYDELFASLPPNIKYVVVMGETKEKLSEAARNTGYKSVIEASGLEDAVCIAKRLDVENVLLSPAAASFDRYENYEKRGEHFERLICE